MQPFQQGLYSWKCEVGGEWTHMSVGDRSTQLEYSSTYVGKIFLLFAVTVIY